MSVYDLSVPRPPAIEPEAAPNSQSAPSRTGSWSTALLTVVGALFYFVGWLAGSLCVPVGVAARWLAAAVATGWDDASTSWHRTGRMDP